MPLILGQDLTLEEFCAEPDEHSPEWLPTVYARLLVVSRGWRYLEGVYGAPRFEPEYLARTRDAVQGGLNGLFSSYADDLGSPAPRLVLVGERRSNGILYPFCGRPGYRLWRALRIMGHDELTVFVTHSLKPDKSRRTEQMKTLADSLEGRPTWVALGTMAQRVLRAAEIDHVVTRHPNWHSRFRYREGPEGYSALLTDDGVPCGRWITEQLPVVHSPERPRLLDVVEGAPPDVPTSRKRRPVAQKIPPSRNRQKARMDFVTGVCPTVKEAAEKHGFQQNALQEVSRVEGWHEERDEQAERTREAVYESAARREAREMSQLRALILGAARKAAASVTQRLLAGEMKPSISEAARLGQAALDLVRYGDAGTEEQVARYLEMPWQKLRKEFLEADDGIYGPEPKG
jgi:hypothetical protein